MRTRSGWRCSMCCALWPSAGPVARGARRPPVARSGFRRRVPDRPPAAARRAGRAAGDRSGWGRSWRSRSSSIAPSRTSGSSDLTLGPLSLGAVHDLLKERLGLELTRPELVRVQEATAGNPFFALELGRELVRTNTRPDARPGVARAREPAGAARRPSGPPADRHRRRPAPGRSARSADGRAGGGRARRRERVARGARGGRARGCGRARRLARPLLAPAARLDLLRAGAGLEAPRRSPGARGRRLGRRGAGPAPGARRGRARRSRRVRAGRRGRAGGRARGDRRRGRALRSSPPS